MSSAGLSSPGKVAKHRARVSCVCAIFFRKGRVDRSAKRRAEWRRNPIGSLSRQGPVGGVFTLGNRGSRRVASSGVAESRGRRAERARAARRTGALASARTRARSPRERSPRNRTHRGGLASCAERRGGETHRRDRHRGAARGREGRGRGARDGAHRGLAENLRDTTHGSSRRAEGVSWCARSGGVDGRLGWSANSFRFFRADQRSEAGSVTQEAARDRERPEP